MKAKSKITQLKADKTKTTTFSIPIKEDREGSFCFRFFYNFYSAFWSPVKKGGAKEGREGKSQFVFIFSKGTENRNSIWGSVLTWRGS